MMTAILVFVAQFTYILLLGLQQLNVVGRHYVRAQFVSLALGICGYQLTATIALHAEQPIGSAVWWSFILAGPIAITVAMWIYPRPTRKVQRDNGRQPYGNRNDP